jgi:phosphate-selective porin OprO/OprP
MPLADRVAALEKYVREIQSAEEEEEEEEVAGACVPKEIPIIVKPTYKLRGRLFFDGVTYDDDDATSAFFNDNRQNETGFDTARIGLQGYVYENVEYIIEIEFEGTEVDYKDVFMEAQSLPLIGNFRAGHYKEPIGLEELTSSRYITFMKRSYATSSFAPSRNFGMMMYNSLDACDDLSWFMGTFRSDSDDSPPGYADEREDANDWTFDTRVAWLPYYDEPSEGRHLVHLGGSYSYRNTVDPSEFTTKAWIGGQAPIGVGAVAQSDHYSQVGAEFAVVWCALSVQSEFYQAWVTSGEKYDGAYVQLSYFLTGEHRGYKKAGKCFDRVHPFEPAFWIDARRGPCFGRGAWELAAAYSYSDLRDGADIETGVEERALVDGFIVGVNWYLNPYSRVMIDYNLESTDFVRAGTPDSTANLFGVRWQVDW